MADPALGAKQICPNCQAKFYDLNRRPAHCPKCANEFDPEEAVKFRRIRARSTTPDYETDEEAESQVKAKAASDEDEDEDEVITPEIDEVVEEPLVVGDDDEPAVVEPDAPPVTEIDIEADVELEEEDDAVPFIEDEEDDDAFEEDIDLPGEGEEH